MKALILFGHGARDVRWREPFDRLAQKWKVQHADTLLELAFLEMMQPSLEEAVAALGAFAPLREASCCFFSTAPTR